MLYCYSVSVAVCLESDLWYGGWLFLKMWSLKLDSNNIFCPSLQDTVFLCMLNMYFGCRAFSLCDFSCVCPYTDTNLCLDKHIPLNLPQEPCPYKLDDTNYFKHELFLYILCSITETLDSICCHWWRHEEFSFWSHIWCFVALGLWLWFIWENCLHLL